MKKAFSLLDWVLGIQGSYYVLTGIWPFMHLSSFEAVTGPKNNIFLLHMVSALIIVIGIALLLSIRQEKTRSIIFLATGSPLAFMVIEIIYRAQIHWVYFLDFAVEVILLAAIGYGYFRYKKGEQENPASSTPNDTST